MHDQVLGKVTFEGKLQGAQLASKLFLRHVLRVLVRLQLGRTVEAGRTARAMMPTGCIVHLVVQLQIALVHVGFVAAIAGVAGSTVHFFVELLVRFGVDRLAARFTFIANSFRVSVFGFGIIIGFHRGQFMSLWG